MTAHAKTEKPLDLEQLISDYGATVPGKKPETAAEEKKYRDIVRAMQWARHLRRQEESRGMTMAELIDRALLDVVSGKVQVEEIEEAVKKDAEIEEKLSARRPDSAGRIRRDDKPARDAA